MKYPMNNIFNKLLEPLRIKLPKEVTDAFGQQFPKAYNTEWSKHKKEFEVIFYLDEQECIAGYAETGHCLFIKRNLKLEQVPEIFENVLTSDWELMNLLEIEEGNTLHYECIVRDKELVRYAWYIDQEGQVLTREKL